MTLAAGRYEIGADRDRLVLKTSREGLAATAGHDLIIDVTRWSGEVTVSGDSAALQARIDLRSLAVREGTGGVVALSARDKREIEANAARSMAVDRYPEATFDEATFESGVISGTLRLAGQSGPIRLRVSETGPGTYHATGSVVQTSFGIKPYRGFFGALKVRDAVDVEVDVDLSGPGS
ncbi:MAG TPA: YceI family protein [Streptosporangiaceae bacterium]|nr:YceI family protein [Streptosporangiaceae bacterium]